MRTTAALTALCGLATVSLAGGVPMTIDFSTDDGGNALVNGQEINVGEEFGNLVDISSSDRLAIFDTDPTGPNAGGSDSDLLVDLGNALIVQDPGELTQTVPDIFDTPDDFAGTSDVSFDFLSPVELFSVTLIDINGGVTVTVVLTDTSGNTRTYDVPQQWTNDVSVAPIGYADLDLTTLADQDAEGAGGAATASEDAGFDASSVVSADFTFTGSAALDNVTFIPAPGALALGCVGGLAMASRRRR